MTGTRTGMRWPVWKPVQVTSRKVIQETGSQSTQLSSIRREEDSGEPASLQRGRKV